MGILEIVGSIIVCIVSLWLGSIEKRFKSMEDRLNKSITRDEAGNLIDLKQMPIRVLQNELKEDIKEIKGHIEQIRDAVCRRP